jgi:hypothetical protein
MQKSALRRRAEAALRCPIPDRVWAWADRQGYVQDAEASEDGYHALLEYLRDSRLASAEWVRPLEPGKKRRDPRRGPEQRRALSVLAAAEIALHERVVDFREKYLDAGVLAWKDIGDWIAQMAERDGESTSDLTVTIVHSQLVYKPPQMAYLDPPLTTLPQWKVSRQSLDYALPGDEWRHCVPVVAGGGLDHLRRLSEWLAEWCGWHPGQATVFVLAAVCPLISNVRATTAIAPNRPVWSRRFQLDISPCATVEDVVAAFHQARKEQGLDRRRVPATKLSVLAVFAMADNVDKPWSERQVLWNQRYPEWRYEHASNFRRDAALAAKRLLDG